MTSVRLPSPVLVVLLFLLMTGCNEPPLYRKHASEFLREQGVPGDVIDKLTTMQPLEPEMAERLSWYERESVLHLVGANPGTPISVIERLARHPSFEVRTGVASHANIPLELLLEMRTVGEYTTVNSVIASHPRLPHAVIWEMLENGEAGYDSFARNPNCPTELMRQMVAKSDWRTTGDPKGELAQNPNAPEDVLRALAADKSEFVRMRLTFNSSLPDDLVCRLHIDASKLVREHVESRVEKKLYPRCDRSEPITDPIAYLNDPIAYRGECPPSRSDMVKRWCGGR